MNKAFALGAAGALAAFLAAGSAQAQGFGVSIGYGDPYYHEPYSWGGPRYVGSYYAPVGAYGYDHGYAPRTVVTTRRVVTAPAYEEFYDEPRTVVRTRRVVTAAPVYYAPRRVVRSQRVVYRAPAYRPARVVRTREVIHDPAFEPGFGETRIVTGRTIQY